MLLRLPHIISSKRLRIPNGVHDTSNIRATKLVETRRCRLKPIFHLANLFTRIEYICEYKLYLFDPRDVRNSVF